jgi:hypothetical protein
MKRFALPRNDIFLYNAFGPIIDMLCDRIFLISNFGVLDLIGHIRVLLLLLVRKRS